MPAPLPFTHCITCNRELKRNNIVRGNCMTCNRRLVYRSNPDVRQKSIGYAKRWQREHPDRARTIRKNRSREQQRMYEREYRRRLRHDALLILGNGHIRCINCGCDDERIIEINHINGGGRQARKKIDDMSKRFYLDIIYNRVSFTHLNLLCKICNALHYIELRFGYIPFEIIYRGEK